MATEDCRVGVGNAIFEQPLKSWWCGLVSTLLSYVLVLYSDYFLSEWFTDRTSFPFPLVLFLRFLMLLWLSLHD